MGLVFFLLRRRWAPTPADRFCAPTSMSPAPPTPRWKRGLVADPLPGLTALPDSRIYGFSNGDPQFHTHPHLDGACSSHPGGHLPHSHPQVSR